jgi:threonine dehydrogenase-like Zn-dependent dehydrogenase
MTDQVVSLGTVFTGSSGGRIVKRQGGQRKVGPRSVVIKITHSGLCGSDLHFLEKDDMVLGHEPVGVVSQVRRKRPLDGRSSIDRCYL